MVDIWQWFVDNSQALIVTAIAILISWIIYKLITRQVKKFYGEEEEEKKEQAKTINKIIKAIYIVVVIGVIFSQFGEGLGTIFGGLALVSGTILGFAAMNTIGNALAGLIIMISKPIQTGDHILFQGKEANVLSIKFIFSRIQYNDGTIVSIANQKLLDEPLTNFSLSGEPIRRRIKITLDYEEDEDEILRILEETVAKVEGVSKKKKPQASISGLLDYALGYQCMYWILDAHSLKSTMRNVRLAVLKMCKQRDLDLTMPILHQDLTRLAVHKEKPE